MAPTQTAAEPGDPAMPPHPPKSGPRRSLVFALNGIRMELPSPDPSMTLLTFLRCHTRFSGTKLGCGEGGCGACLVLLSKYDINSDSFEEFSINSCLTPLCLVDGCAVTTVEGLRGGSPGSGALHSVHERVAGFHGSQCGFCTPGMCVSIYSCLSNSAARHKGHVGNDDSKHINGGDDHHTIPGLSLADAQTAIVGNICRCTGYRPILDACKSFSAEVDVEDLGINTFWRSSEEANVNLLPPFRKATNSGFPNFLIEELNLRSEQTPLSVHDEEKEIVWKTDLNGCIGKEKVWIQAKTLDSAFNALQMYPCSNDVKFVVGNTSSGYYKDQIPNIFIDISRIPALLNVQETSTSLLIGAAITIEKLINLLQDRDATYHDSVSHGLVLHLKKVANPHVRHRASVGGNLIMAQRFSFASDLATLFLAVGATLQLVGPNAKQYELTMEEFLQNGLMEPHMLLKSICLPLSQSTESGGVLSGPHSNSKGRQIFKSYRAAPRQLGNALAFINAAFLFNVSPPSEETNGFYSISDARLAFGAFGKAHAMRVYSAENFLTGKIVNPSNLLQAVEILKDELASCLEGIKNARYKSSVAIGFFFDFFRPFLATSANNTKGGTDLESVFSNGNRASSCSLEFSTYSDAYDGGFNISGKQTVPEYEEDHSLGKAVQKSEAKIQAAGEAVYVDDIPSPNGCLFAAFVLSTKAFARVKFIDPEPALASSGVVVFISAEDIPQNGANVGPLPGFQVETETLFATDIVQYVGHPLGVVVADTQEHAKDGARKVRVEYEVERSPVLCIEDAVSESSFFKTPPVPLPILFTKASVGDIDKGFMEADKNIIDGEVRTGGQYYFYMEAQTALVFPDEDESIVVYSSSQSPQCVQESVSVCLGIPNHNVRVITRRVGGGFGGKAFRNVTVASACAVAAHKLRRPVRMYLDRKTDMIMMGGRHPTKTLYSVGLKSDGKVTSLKVTIFVDGGWSEDFTPLMPLTITSGLKKYDWGSMAVDFKLCKTNLSSKSAMRAPGHLQGSFIADTILEHVASVVGLDVHNVIARNMHTLESLKLFYPFSNPGGSEGFTLPSMWNATLQRIEPKVKEVSIFNSTNTWYKRGLSVLPCIYDVVLASKPARVSIFTDGSVVVEVGGIEMGQGLWTKVKQATIYGLSQLLSDDSIASETLKVRLVQADSISLPRGGLTANSTTSEASCEAVRQACQVLVERIMPLKEKHSKSISWTDLIKQAIFSQVDLSAQVNWFPERTSMSYLNYGIAASVVELNVLTGAVKIIQTDLIYDCGRSLNPAIDIGQIEGSFVQGIGFFLTEEIEIDSNGELISNGTWTYKPPTLDNIPQKFSVEITNGAERCNRVLSSKACGEPPTLLAGTIHSAVRRAIAAARADQSKFSKSRTQSEAEFFQLDTPATMEKVKSLCGLNVVEEYLKYQQSRTE